MQLFGGIYAEDNEKHEYNQPVPGGVQSREDRRDPRLPPRALPLHLPRSRTHAGGACTGHTAKQEHPIPRARGA